PDRLDRSVGREEIRELAAFLRSRIPAAAGALVDHRVCMYTSTPDQHFLIDAHPEHERVVVLSACSGHGFKFASVVGEAAADLVERGQTALPVEFLSAGRFGQRRGTDGATGA